MRHVNAKVSLAVLTTSLVVAILATSVVVRSRISPVGPSRRRTTLKSSSWLPATRTRWIHTRTMATPTRISLLRTACLVARRGP